MLYVSANDGMLHAFDRMTGEEVGHVRARSSATSLADTDYPYTIGSSSMDRPRRRCLGRQKWRTILVGGLNKGRPDLLRTRRDGPREPASAVGVLGRNLGLSFLAIP